MGFKCFSNELKNLELFKKAGGVFTSWLHVTINPLAVVVVLPAARMRCWQRCGLVVVSGESREKVQGSGSGGGGYKMVVVKKLQGVFVATCGGWTGPPDPVICGK